MNRAAAVVATVLATAAPARAQEPTRLVMVAPPATLLEAVTTSVAPWQTEVIVVASDDASAAELAATHGAGFVAVRRGRSIELYDHTTGISQLRPLPATVDDAEAAAIALTIKTWMRLERPASEPEAGTVEPPPTPPPPLAGDGDAGEAPPPIAPRLRAWRLGAAVGLGARGNQGGLASGVRLSAQAEGGWRWLDAVIAVDLGPGVAVSSGTATAWSQTELALRVGPRVRWRDLWGRASVGGAVVWNTLAGTHMTTGRPIEESATDLAAVGAVDVGWTRGRWTAVGTVGADWVSAGRRIGQLRMSVDTHIEPWIAVGAALRLP